MTKQEFADRTKLYVPDEVFNNLNQIYMCSNLDKDEYCAQVDVRMITYSMTREIERLKSKLAEYEEIIAKQDEIERLKSILAEYEEIITKQDEMIDDDRREIRRWRDKIANIYKQC